METRPWRAKKIFGGPQMMLLRPQSFSLFLTHCPGEAFISLLELLTHFRKISLLSAILFNEGWTYLIKLYLNAMLSGLCQEKVQFIIFVSLFPAVKFIGDILL